MPESSSISSCNFFILNLSPINVHIPGHTCTQVVMYSQVWQIDPLHSAFHAESSGSANKLLYNVL